MSSIDSFGAAVRAKGLVGAAHLNGMWGFVEEFDSERVQVRFSESGEVKRLRRVNLELVAAADATGSLHSFQMGDRVVLHGVCNSVELNGRYGSIVSLKDLVDRGRCAVLLEGAVKRRYGSRKDRAPQPLSLRLRNIARANEDIAPDHFDAHVPDELRETTMMAWRGADSVARVRFARATGSFRRVEFDSHAPPFIGLCGESTLDAVGCTLALAQALAPIADTLIGTACEGASLGALLAKARGGARSACLGLPELEGVRLLGEGDVSMCINSLFWLINHENDEQVVYKRRFSKCVACDGDIALSEPLWQPKLLCGHYLHRKCMQTLTKGRVESPQCPACHVAIPPRTFHARVRVPPETSGKFEFSLKTTNGIWRTWNIRSSANAGDIIDVRIILEDDDVIRERGESSFEATLQKIRTPVNPMHFIAMQSSVDCSLCPGAGFYTRNDGSALHLGVANACSLEGLLATHFLAYKGNTMCMACRHPRDTWVYHAAHQCWVKAAHVEIENGYCPETAHLRTCLLSLPPVLCIDLRRSRCTKLGEMKFCCAPVSFPMHALDLAKYLPRGYDVPDSVSTLYDCRFVAEFKPQADAGMRTVASAKEGSYEVPKFGARYIAHAKSLKDERWYEHDVCSSGPAHAPEWDPFSDMTSRTAMVSRMTSRTAIFVVYQRRDLLSPQAMAGASSEVAAKQSKLVSDAKVFVKEFQEEVASGAFAEQMKLVTGATHSRANKRKNKRKRKKLAKVKKQLLVVALSKMNPGPCIFRWTGVAGRDTGTGGGEAIKELELELNENIAEPSASVGQDNDCVVCFDAFMNPIITLCCTRLVCFHCIKQTVAAKTRLLTDAGKTEVMGCPLCGAESELDGVTNVLKWDMCVEKEQVEEFENLLNEDSTDEIAAREKQAAEQQVARDARLEAQKELLNPMHFIALAKRLEEARDAAAEAARNAASNADFVVINMESTCVRLTDKLLQRRACEAVEAARAAANDADAVALELEREAQRQLEAARRQEARTARTAKAARVQEEAARKRALKGAKRKEMMRAKKEACARIAAEEEARKQAALQARIAAQAEQLRASREAERERNRLAYDRDMAAAMNASERTEADAAAARAQQRAEEERAEERRQREQEAWFTSSGGGSDVRVLDEADLLRFLMYDSEGEGEEDAAPVEVPPPQQRRRRGHRSRSPSASSASPPPPSAATAAGTRAQAGHGTAASSAAPEVGPSSQSRKARRRRRRERGGRQGAGTERSSTSLPPPLEVVHAAPPVPAPAAAPAPQPSAAPAPATECVICMEADVTHAFIPCGHHIACRTCADAIMGDTACCPLCRAPSTMTVQIFGPR